MAAPRRCRRGRNCRLSCTAANGQFRLRDDAALEHLHWSTTRSADYPALTVLAMDHRSQFEALCEQVGADPTRIAAFKSLVIEAVDRVAGGDPSFGVLLDGRYGMRALEAAAATCVLDRPPHRTARLLPAGIPNPRPTSRPSWRPGRRTTW